MSTPQLPEGFSWAVDVELGSPEVYHLSKTSWPRFLLEESDIHDPILKFQISVEEFREKFKVYGVRDEASKNLVAFIQTVDVEIDLMAAELPDLGWRFSIQNASMRSRKNCVSLVEASVAPENRGFGLSKCLIQQAKEQAKRRGFRHVIAPVRPTMKVQFPNESIETYCNRKTPDQRLFDPWLRAHVESGATLANICHNSVCVRASLSKWRDWTGLPLLQSGPQIIPGGLMPLMVDLETGVAVYTEPNVWVRYDAF